MTEAPGTIVRGFRARLYPTAGEERRNRVCEDTPRGEIEEQGHDFGFNSVSNISGSHPPKYETDIKARRLQIGE
jgi:hypothetical protein